MPPDWRSLTVTGRARSAIRRHIRQTEKEEFIRLGRASVEQTFERAGKTLADVSLRPALDRFAAATEDELFDAVGRGRVSPTQVLEAVFPGLKETEKAAATARRRIEDGRGRALLRARRRPDAGRLPALRAVLQPRARRPHRRHRPARRRGLDGPHHRLRRAWPSSRTSEELWRDLQWTPEAERNTVSDARLHATIRNAPGVLGQACTIIGEAGGNIVGLQHAPPPVATSSTSTSTSRSRTPAT